MTLIVVLIGIIAVLACATFLIVAIVVPLFLVWKMEKQEGEQK